MPHGRVNKDHLTQPHGPSMPSPANNCQTHPTVTTFPQSSMQLLATAHWLSSSGHSVGNACKFPKLDTLYAIWMIPFHGPCFVTDTCKGANGVQFIFRGALPGVAHLKPTLPHGPKCQKLSPPGHSLQPPGSHRDTCSTQGSSSYYHGNTLDNWLTSLT